MVPAIRNLLGGFLFSGDDIYKKAGVLSGGERTRLAVARMLLRPSNTLLLDEPTNHLDLDSKDVLLDALEDYGGTLIIVSHDRYFVEKLATKIIEIGHGQALVYPGTYKEFLWHKEHSDKIPVDSQLPNSQLPREVRRSRRRRRQKEDRGLGTGDRAPETARPASNWKPSAAKRTARCRPFRSGLPTSRVGLPNGKRWSKSSKPGCRAPAFTMTGTVRSRSSIVIRP